MRVLILTSSYPLHREDPTSFFVHDLARHLAASGHRVRVVAPAHGRSAHFEVLDQVEVYRFRYMPVPVSLTLAYGSGGAENLRSPAALAQVPFFSTSFLMKAWRAGAGSQLIHAHWIPPGGIGVLLRGLRGIPLVVSIHRMNSASNIWKMMNRFVLSRADYLLFNSRYTKALGDSLTGRYGDTHAESIGEGTSGGGDEALTVGVVETPEGGAVDTLGGRDIDTLARRKGNICATGDGERNRRDVLGPGIDTAVFSCDPRTKKECRRYLCARYSIDGESKIFLSVGRLVEKKGHRYLLAALASVAGTQPCLPEWTLLVAGWGHLREPLEDLARELGIARSVRFAGKIPPQERVRCFQGSDLFLLPSIVDSSGETETLGVVLMEAMASGLPCIASAVGGIPEVVEDGVTGVLVPPKDSGALRKAIEDYLRTPAHFNEMGEKGMARAVKEFDWKGRISRIEEIYRECLGAKRHRAEP
jgi:glycosyltransferase involved in cell wall biosynthesis